MIADASATIGRCGAPGSGRDAGRHRPDRGAFLREDWGDRRATLDFATSHPETHPFVADAEGWRAPRLVRGDSPEWQPAGIWGQFNLALG
jgi:hypothetical protein